MTQPPQPPEQQPRMRMSRGKKIGIALAAACVLPFAAACSEESGTAERSAPAAPKADTEPSVDEGAACDPESDLSQAEWLEECGDTADAAEAEDELPETELKVGDTYRYPDGLRITVTRISRVTQFSEYDSRPEAGQTAFRAHIKFDNQSKKPVTLDDFALSVQGSSKGGDAEFTTWEAGAKEISGRLAAGQADTKTEDGVLDKQYGTDLLITVTRMTDDADFFDEDPKWTGAIG